jgi:hypothetical protein
MSPPHIEDSGMSKQAPAKKRQTMIEAVRRKRISPVKEKKKVNRKIARKGEPSYAKVSKTNTGNEDSQEENSGK